MLLRLHGFQPYFYAAAPHLEGFETAAEQQWDVQQLQRVQVCGWREGGRAKGRDALQRPRALLPACCLLWFSCPVTFPVPARLFSPKPTEQGPEAL